MKSEFELLQEAKAFIRKTTSFEPKVALLLGSGLGPVSEALEPVAVFKSETIPHFPKCTVVAHEGTLALGKLGGLDCLALRGRFHLYEGYSVREIVRPVRLARLLGAQILVVTNAAGGIRADLQPGDLMLISDHINLTGVNPLTGDNEEPLGTRFPDMSEAYDKSLRTLARDEARAAGFPLAEGVYAGLAGPSYETPAEIRMLRNVGADAVGMSTVCEVIAGVHAGLRVLGVSCITNRAAGLSEGRLSHEEVLATTSKYKDRYSELIARVLRRFAKDGVK
ncbi:MAG: purine-nucleoside phosphorylase [Planctomycetes bacterium]|nr:purine-nucleoside phosphorylase [Planctomycetota bacterium]MBI3847240.1 purine-nucleoside phosphorylase [Planctomycetota bacterium]